MRRACKRLQEDGGGGGRSEELEELRGLADHQVSDRLERRHHGA